MTDSEDKRRFSRWPCDATAELRQAGASWRAAVVDLSLRGILTATAPGFAPQPDEQFEISIVLEGSQELIFMAATVAHVEPERVGFRCDHIDLDSITMLRRLVELNLGAPELLDRELAELG